MSYKPEGYFSVVGDRDRHQSARKIHRVCLLELAFGVTFTLYTGH